MVCISRRAWPASVVVLLAWTITCPAEEEPLFTFLQFSDVHVGNDINKPVHKRLVAPIAEAERGCGRVAIEDSLRFSVGAIHRVAA